jgi:hypothetical protein
MPNCTHLDSIPRSDTLLGVAPSARGCQDCLPDHDDWLHLRRCVHCGRVLCCEGSPRQHAKAHASTSEHCVVQSFEPGEDWLWCYDDEVFLHDPTPGPSPSYADGSLK